MLFHVGDNIEPGVDQHNQKLMMNKPMPEKPSTFKRILVRLYKFIFDILKMIPPYYLQITIGIYIIEVIFKKPAGLICRDDTSM